MGSVMSRATLGALITAAALVTVGGGFVLTTLMRSGAEGGPCYFCGVPRLLGISLGAGILVAGAVILTKRDKS